MREQGGLGVVPDLHLCEDQRQDRGAEVDLAPRLTRCMPALECPDRVFGADDGLELVALVDGRCRLRTVRESATGKEPERRLIPRADIAQPVATLGERAASSHREGNDDVGRDESQALDGDRGSAWDGPYVAIDRVRSRQERRVGVRFDIAGVPRSQDDVIDLEALPVRHHDSLAPVPLAHDVDRFGVAVDDLQLRGCRRDQGRIEPLQVLAHEPARDVVVAGYLAPGATDLAGVAHPAVAGARNPLVQAHGVRGRWTRVLPRIERDLPTRSVEDQIVGLVHCIDTRAGRAGRNSTMWTLTGPHCEREPVTMRSRKLSPHEPSPMIAISIRRRFSDTRARAEATTVPLPFWASRAPR